MNRDSFEKFLTSVFGPGIVVVINEGDRLAAMIKYRIVATMTPDSVNCLGIEFHPDTMDQNVNRCREEVANRMDTAIRNVVNTGAMTRLNLGYFRFNDRLSVSPDGVVEVEGRATDDLGAWRYALGMDRFLTADEAAPLIAKSRGTSGGKQPHITPQHFLKLAASGDIPAIHIRPTGMDAKGVYVIPEGRARNIVRPGSGRTTKTEEPIIIP